ncbi:hypothetical protein EJB05_07081, partial [Eragrostis curvula]
MHAADWAWWLGLLLGAVPLLALAVWHCNDAAFALVQFRRRRCRVRLPPGHMGLPFVGESLSLLWYFKLARRPDGFVEDKRRRYGGGGVYRTHLFGSPTVLVCSPAANKFVLQSPDSFGIRWPAPELVGVSCLVNVEGAQHARLRGFILATINRPSALRVIAEVVQPRVAAALQSWADKGTIIAATEVKKVTFENICKMFVSMDPSPLTDMIDGWFTGLVAGFRAFPLDIPGTAFRHARSVRGANHEVALQMVYATITISDFLPKQWRKKLDAVFRGEVERRRKEPLDREDLMGGLMQMEDERGSKLCDDEVVNNIVSLVVAGYESTSNAIISKNGGFITLDDIPNMKYTAKVVEETIRLANIAPTVFRVAHKDVEYRGYTIPKGWRVVVWIRSLHTDPEYYDDPLNFNPDRWDKPPKPGTYQVFGGGYRICAGNMLARLQLTIMLHHLSVGYK